MAQAFRTGRLTTLAAALIVAVPPGVRAAEPAPATTGATQAGAQVANGFGPGAAEQRVGRRGESPLGSH
mgnify:CR=1 FL=1